MLASSYRTVADRLFARIAIATVAVLACAVVPAVGQDTKAIVVLHTYGHDTPLRIPFDQAFLRATTGQPDSGVEVYIETLDLNRFTGPAQAERMRAALRDKYAGKRIATVAVVYDRGLAFLRESEPLFPGVPVVAALTRFPTGLPADIAVTWSGSRYGESAALAMKLHPNTRQFVLVDGAPEGPGRGELSEEATRQIQQTVPDIPVVSLRDLPLDELLPQVQALPPDSIIIVMRQTLGRAGQAISSAAAIEAMSPISPAPIYVSTDLQVGSGGLGGIVVSIEQQANALATLALNAARGGSPPAAPVMEAGIPMFDWRQLQRWGVSDSSLPAGSVVLFRQLSTWEKYKNYIAGAVVLLGVQTALIIGLLVQRAKRRRVEVALSESERHFRTMADTAPVLIWRSRVDDGCDFFNKPWLDFRGRPLEQELGFGWTEGIHPDDRALFEQRDTADRSARAPLHREYRLRRGDGEYRWLLDIGVPRYDDTGGFAGYIGSAVDITERKQIEESYRASEAALRQSVEQNQDLAGRLIHAQEAERARIARDLHDDLSQQLAAVSIMLTGLTRSVSRAGMPSEMAAAVTAVQERTTTLAHSLRHLSHDLHPDMLKHAGLPAALTEHCAEVQRHHGLAVNFNTAGAFGGLHAEVALCLYRVTQEALSNVVRHARACTVRVELDGTASTVHLRITDDGIGFNATERARSGLGLRSIDERVRLAGGDLRIDTRPGRGTALLVHIPLPAPHEPTPAL